MSTQNPIQEEPVSWKVEDMDVNATLARPAGEGPFPAVIFVAGSGPTDRNWNSPLLQGSNGSGALLARALAENGFLTLRYDKRASGPQANENAARMMGKISMQGHVDELAGGVNLLAGRPEVNPGQIFALTNSEGCVHALNYQTQAPAHPFAGMVLTSPFARAAGQLAHTQIAAQLAAVPGGDDMLASYDAAIQQFIAGRPVTIDESLPEPLRQMIQAITLPVNQPFARELWIFSPTGKLAEVKAPVLIVLGKKDIQVDWQVEGPLLEAVAKEHGNIQVVYLENANHVMKFEALPADQLSAAHAMLTYGADETMLDPLAVQAITSWLKDQL